MKCHQCGTEALVEAVFCQKCGARLGAPAANTASGTAGDGTVDPAAAVGARLRRSIRDVPEEVLWEGGYSPKAMLGVWIVAAFVSLAVLGACVFAPPFLLPAVGIVILLWILLGLRLILIRMGVHYKLTNQRFFHERGILQRVTNRIEVIDIDDLTIEQGLIDRFLNVGRIKISAKSDRTDPELWLNGIDDVQKVFALIDSARRAERLRRGISVEAI